MEKSKGSTSKKNKDGGSDKVVDFLVMEFEKYEKYWEPVFTEAKEIIDNWECVPPPREHDWQNQVASPATIEAEQTITPRIFTALFPTDAPLDLIVEGQTPPTDGIIIKGLIQHYFRVAKVRGQSLSPLTQTTLLGTGYVENGSWLMKKGYIVENGERRRVITESRPNFAPVDFFEIFPHPAKLEVDDEFPMFRRQFVGAEDIKRLSENSFFSFDDIQKALDSRCDVKDQDVDFDDNENKRYEVLTYWGPWDEEYIQKDDKGNEKKTTKAAVPYWTIIINRKIKIRHLPNPYLHQQAPYSKLKLFASPRPSWFGVGVGKVGKPTQDRLNKIINQRLDNVDLVIMRQGLYNGNDPLLNAKQLQLAKPGKFHKCSDTLSSVKWMDIPDVTASSYKEEELARNDFRESVGAISALMPAEDKNEQHRTAMGIQILQGAAGMRFKPVLIKLEEDYIAKTADFFFINSKQFMATPEWVEIMGEGATKMIQVTPDQIMRKVRFIPTGVSETVNKEIQVGQLLRFKEISQNDPTINRSEINKRIAELMGFKDIEKLIVHQLPPTKAPGGLSPEQGNLIKQRLAEGANPEQIKMEMLGPAPSPEQGGM